MAERPIRLFGDPILTSTTDPVDVGAPRTRELVADLLDTVKLPGRAGVAANQIGVGLRAFSYNIDGSVGYLLNPRLVKVWGEPEDMSEGCLSVPGERYPLLRADTATLSALNISGENYTIHAEGWLARIFQHEFDHLDGTLYVDRLDAKNQKLARKAIKTNGWGEPGNTWSPGQDFLEP